MYESFCYLTRYSFTKRPGGFFNHICFALRCFRMCFKLLPKQLAAYFQFVFSSNCRRLIRHFGFYFFRNVCKENLKSPSQWSLYICVVMECCSYCMKCSTGWCKYSRKNSVTETRDLLLWDKLYRRYLFLHPVIAKVITPHLHLRNWICGWKSIAATVLEKLMLQLVFYYSTED